MLVERTVRLGGLVEGKALGNMDLERASLDACVEALDHLGVDVAIVATHLHVWSRLGLRLNARAQSGQRPVGHVAAGGEQPKNQIRRFSDP